MKRFTMPSPKDKPPGPRMPNQSRRVDTAFDVFLQRGLQELYGKVLDEPTPPDLLKIIADDRDGKKTK
jgi:hypothetical protein